MIQRLSNQFLVRVYVQAMTLKLDSHFIYLLEKEVKKRDLPLQYQTHQWQNIKSSL
ncbi:sporulation histidine kinase inhibitor Sda [Bacillus taeanensis]|uniref:Sporulation histidine kinase inhibitor Sda n=1 Tax=Bacillus taeanensis TaxID=273032 RepID=A0A366XRF5_9BACI|nr:sporulation histidine kinase inhibitor Sda [Bacillus taeanensis]RBW68477.1 sporulation histidine kinase inhibitor Sda [Bacillus taeanensis]